MSDAISTPDAGESVTADAVAAPTAEVDAEAQLGDAGKKAIQAERDARKAAEKANAELAARLKEFEDSKLSELEKAQRAATESAAELAALRAENIRKSVALEKGVPSDLVEFLTGDTEEQVAAKADALLARLNIQQPSGPRPDPSQGAKASQPSLGADPLLDALKNKLGIS